MAAAKGYRLTLVMPESMSLERRAILRALGADFVLSPRGQGHEGRHGEGRRTAAETSECLDAAAVRQPGQSRGSTNDDGPEIWDDLDGQVDIVVAGVGTGGTITGVTRYLRTKNPRVQAIAVEPAESPVISGGMPGSHRIQGIGAGFVPANLDTSLLDDVETVSSDEAFRWARRLAREEGLFGGISTGAQRGGRSSTGRGAAQSRQDDRHVCQ